MASLWTTLHERRGFPDILMKRRHFIKSGALFVPTIFPRLVRAQANTYRDIAWLINRNTPAAGGITAPTDISGLQAWWKADSLGLSDNTLVATWSTAGGPSRDATASGTDRPTFKTAIQNGKAVVRFSTSVANALTFSTTTIPNFSMFVCMSLTTSNPIYGGPLRWRTAAESGFVFAHDGTGVFQPLLSIWNGASEASNNHSTGTYSYPSAFGLWEMFSTPTIFNNGASVTISSGASGWSSGANIGHGYSYMDGDIGEIVVYDSVLSASDRAKVENYLNARWAMY